MFSAKFSPVKSSSPLSIPFYENARLQSVAKVLSTLIELRADVNLACPGLKLAATSVKGFVEGLGLGFKVRVERTSDLKPRTESCMTLMIMY